MQDTCLISICVPAYKRTDFLKRLLDSAGIQSFRDFEVVITDDSPDDAVSNLVKSYQHLFQVRYFRNSVSLGTPENWNEAIRRSSGRWIKIMHDDDWFSNADALAVFEKAIRNNPSSDFFFSAYSNVFFDKAGREDVFVNAFRLKRLKADPASLISANIIGPPSVVLYRKRNDITFDPSLKWLVDIDFYIHYLSGARAVYIPSLLISIGISPIQVTKQSFLNRNVEIPEGLHLVDRLGYRVFKNILVYDAWWRLLRNLRITKMEEIFSTGYKGIVKQPIISMLTWQKNIPGFILRTKIFSKILMSLSYLFNIKKME